MQTVVYFFPEHSCINRQILIKLDTNVMPLNVTTPFTPYRELARHSTIESFGDRN
jgi:hypothetical protein